MARRGRATLRGGSVSPSSSAEVCAVTPTSLLEETLAYASLGWRVLPVGMDKKPLITGWPEVASTDPDVIRRWWEQFPEAQIGILLGQAGGLLVLDVDVPGGQDSLDTLSDFIGMQIKATVSEFTPSGGQHLYFRYPDGHSIKKSTPLGPEYPKLDLLADGCYVVVAPSIGENGEYMWEATSSPFDNEPGLLPDPLLQFLLENQRRRDRSTSPVIVGDIPEGVRNRTFTSMAGTMRRKGMSEEAMFSALMTENIARCNPPLPESEVRSITKSIASYTPESPAYEVCTHPVIWSPPAGPAASLDEVQAAVDRFMPGIDLCVVRTIMATFVANLLGDVPAWLIAVGGSSSGRSEVLHSLAGLPLVHPVDRITCSGLLSGTARNQMKSDDPGGLLDQVGDHGILTISDFSTILSLDRRQRSSLFGALRRIYDGEYAIQPGTGGTTRYWRGKIGLIAAATGGLDSHRSFMAEMGPRAMLVRENTDPLAGLDSPTALASVHERETLRQEFHDTVRGLIAGLDIPEDLPEIPLEQALVINTIAALAAQARSPVERDNQGTPTGSEMVEHRHRLALELAAVFRALKVIGLDSDSALKDIVRIGINTISPPIRAEIILELHRQDRLSAYSICLTISRAETTVRRELEALRLLRLVQVDRGSDTEVWSLSGIAKRLFEPLASFMDRDST